MTIDVDVAARLFRGLPTFRSFRRIVKRVSSELPDGRNLLIKFSHLHSAPFDPKASAVHQLTSSFGSISGVSHAEGAFGNQPLRLLHLRLGTLACLLFPLRAEFESQPTWFSHPPAC
ncbi:MAG: hypothetical protein ACTS46_01670 [Candidatus Hodgkinia cicadicola]